MTVQQQIQTGDRIMAMLVAGLQIEFGRHAGQHLARRFLEAEATDFRWEGRLQERWLGSYESLDDEDVELDRVALLGRLEGGWYVAVCIVDGDGRAHGLVSERRFEVRHQAERALAEAR